MSSKNLWLVRGSLIGAVIGAASALSVPAYAEDLQPTDQAGAQPAAEASDEEAIIVTAQRRAERLEDVPMAVQVVTDEQIENAGVNNFMDLSKLAPGVNMSFSGSVPGVSVRGISSSISGYNVEPNTAVYIDGFYDPQPVTMAADMANLQNIQILKGPQGTLYGRNATGGAILINTLGPSEDYTGRFDFSFGRYNTVEGNAYVAGPISDIMRFSLSGHVRYGHQPARKADPNVIGGTIGSAGKFEYENFRAKLEFDLADNFTALLGFNHSFIDDYRANYFSTYDHIPATITGTALPFPAPPLRPTRFGVVAYDLPNLQFAETNEGTLKLTWDTDVGTLTSYTGYAKRNFGNNVDFDGTYVSINNLIIRYKEQTFQQAVDFTLDSIDNLVLNIGGLYYRDDLEQKGDTGFTTTSFGNFFSFSQGNSYSRAWAIYVDGTYEVTDKLSVNLGGRYSYDKKTFNYQQASILASQVRPFIENSESWTEFTPRATIRYEIMDRTNVYASFSKGYRAGAFSAQGPVLGLLDPAEPEKITAYEVGVKAAWRKVRFEAAAFYYDYTNLQVTTTVPLPGGGVTSVLRNAPGAKVKGVEASFDANPVEGLTLRGGIAFLDAYYSDFPNAVGTGVNATNTLNLGGQVQDWTGHELVRAPNYSGSVGLDYELPTEVGKFLFTTTLSFTDSFVVSNPSLYGPLAPVELRDKQRLRQDAYATLSAQLSWTDSSDHLTVSIYGHNLTDKKYRLSYNAGGNGDYSTMAEPRTYGVRVGYKF